MAVYWDWIEEREDRRMGKEQTSDKRLTVTDYLHACPECGHMCQSNVYCMAKCVFCHIAFETNVDDDE